MKVGENMNEIYLKLAKEVETEVICWRRDLHQCPELGLELPKTVAYVCKILDELGIKYEHHYINGNGVVAHIEGLLKGRENQKIPVIALRADMDGLPIHEETDLSFASQQNMHACGHDGHTAILLGTAKLLQENRQNFSGIVKLIFQPGEEYPGGAKPMIEEGALRNPKPDRIFGFHIGKLSEEVPDGCIGTRSLAMMASMDRFQITLTGKGFHAAYPEKANDPIIAMTQLVNAIQTIVSRNIRSLDAAVVSVTRIQGGFNQNIIPDQVEIEGTVRTFSDDIRRQIHQRLDQLASGISAAMQVDYDLVYDYKYPALVNDPEVTQWTLDCLAQWFGPDQVISIPDPVMGGEDFAFYLREVPGTFIYLSNPGYIEGNFHGHHHPKFDIDESYLYKAVATFYGLTIEYFNQSSESL